MSTERQHSRLLEATFAVVAEEGYREMTVGRVAARASLSRRTFYELFSDREDCFLYAFDYALDVLVERARPAFESEREWVASVRSSRPAACPQRSRRRERRLDMRVDSGYLDPLPGAR
jgi:AcrR family transcriptional regulator